MKILQEKFTRNSIRITLLSNGAEKTKERDCNFVTYLNIHFQGNQMEVRQRVRWSFHGGSQGGLW